MNHKVSIIIPVYKAEVFLSKTLNSVLTQDYDNIEVVIVNDCSPDNSLSICKHFADRDPRIKVIDKTINEGVEAARITGIENSTGDYITFLDADDSLCPGAVKVLVDIANAHNVDIVYGNCIRIFSERFHVEKYYKFDPDITDIRIEGNAKDDLMISFFGVNIVPVRVWGNLYRRLLFDAPLCKTGLKFGEDLIMGMQLYEKARSLYITDRPIVNYRWGGVTAGYQPNFLENCRYLFVKKMEYLGGKKGSEKFKRTTVIEMVNCLATHVLQLAEYFPNREKDNIESLRQEMSDSVYSAFKFVEDDPYFQVGELNTACQQLAYKQAYEIACRITHTPKMRIRHRIKLLAASILKHIRL